MIINCADRVARSRPPLLRRTSAVVVSTAVALGLLAGPAFARVDPPTPEVRVSGEGRVLAVPDVLRLNAGVEVRRETAGLAYRAARDVAGRLMQALRGAGVADRDVSTQDLTLGPEYVPDRYPEIARYRASQGVEAVIRDLTRIDAVLDAVAAVGDETRMTGISFEVSDPVKALRDARAAAFRDALAKARQYAKLSGRTLGRATLVSEEQGSAPRPIPYGSAAAAGATSSISPGQQTISVSVLVRYELR
ncbi:SIMPL domain-containing protein [Rhizohabitans arisaemae]|uniref:SIMPL domain-containing protein n=1 Tax=Rhizohabitans arisaemae TaxID=2720610 RepID=UPI0024B0DA5E|nr:SIMPL domain-containing protein [Rhizohabitans arisaemae]